MGGECWALSIEYWALSIERCALAHRSSLTAHRSPLTAHRSPFPAHRSPFPAHRSPFPAHRSPFPAHRSPFPAHRSSLIAHRFRLIAHRSSLIAHRFRLIASGSSLPAHRSSLIAHRFRLTAPSTPTAVKVRVSPTLIKVNPLLCGRNWRLSYLLSIHRTFLLHDVRIPETYCHESVGRRRTPRRKRCRCRPGVGRGGLCFTDGTWRPGQGLPVGSTGDASDAGHVR